MVRPPPPRKTKCLICGCYLNRGGEYAKPTVEGRSHATRHHNVAERFLYKQDRAGNPKTPIFNPDPWNLGSYTQEFCYECHEVLLHNPVILPEDVDRFSELVRIKRLDESQKTESTEPIAGRIILLHEV